MKYGNNSLWMNMIHFKLSFPLLSGHKVEVGDVFMYINITGIMFFSVFLSVHFYLSYKQDTQHMCLSASLSC